ncbi:unnamed protein product [Ilex paraguariensis]|uniref:Exostosin GT47 domain-containing protein n=1 Tax=Ilex paraguariensis TaxID=185542 RepID=A0ABC8QYP0_9AQUA
MAVSVFFFSFFSHRHLRESLKSLFYVPASLAFMTFIFLLIYISSTSKLIIHTHHIHQLHIKPPLQLSTITSPLPTSPIVRISPENLFENSSLGLPEPDEVNDNPLLHNVMENSESQLSQGGVLQMASNGFTVTETYESNNEVNNNEVLPEKDINEELPEKDIFMNNTELNNKEVSHDHQDIFVHKNEVFHDPEIFLQNYKEMNRSLKIYVYPHERNHPFANVLLPEKSEPGGNYASESFFKKALMKSHFITKDPSEADLFYLPFSIAGLRNDRRVGVGGIKDFIRDYVYKVSHEYPYWNRTGGADHFYVACHSVGRSAMEKAVEVKLNAIQMVCSSSYFLPGYIAHKDASVPQIWPRKGDPPTRAPSKRKKLAFFAGAMNSRVRGYLLQQWRNDSEIFVNQGRLKTPYSEALLNSKFCIHAKGFEVNTARIGDAMYYGCVPIILADHYDLPYADVLDWESFALVVSTVDIPLLKKILGEIGFDEYRRLQRNVVKVQKHFQWHHLPVDFDAFYMAMYELWLRRSHVRVPLGAL